MNKLLDVVFSPGPRDDQRKLEDDKIISEHDEWWDDACNRYQDLLEGFEEKYKEAVINIIKEHYK